MSVKKVDVSNITKLFEPVSSIVEEFEHDLNNIDDIIRNQSSI